MVKGSTSDQQRWIRTDTNSGYATYTNKATGRCLTGRSPIGFPVVTAETCIFGATKQQWCLNVTKDFQLRLNGAAMKHNSARPLLPGYGESPCDRRVSRRIERR